MTELSEKAKSKAQQRFMGAVLNAKRTGEASTPEVADAAASMKTKDVKDFASTKHKGLPEKKEVKEGKGILDIIPTLKDPAGAGKKFGGASGKAFGKELTAASGKVAAIGAGTYIGSKLIGKMIDGKKKKSNTEVKEEKKGRHPRDQKELDTAQEYIKKNPNFGKKEVKEGASILKVRGKRNTYMGASGDHKRDKEGNIEADFYKKKPAPTGEKWGDKSKRPKKPSGLQVRARRKRNREKREARAAARAASQSVNEGRLDRVMNTVRAYSKKRKADAKKKPTMDSTTQKLHKWRTDKDKDEKRKYVNDIFQ